MDAAPLLNWRVSTPWLFMVEIDIAGMMKWGMRVNSLVGDSWEPDNRPGTLLQMYINNL